LSAIRDDVSACWTGCTQRQPVVKIVVMTGWQVARAEMTTTIFTTDWAEAATAHSPVGDTDAR
jgi:uncharacterized lipoprotein